MRRLANSGEEPELRSQVELHELGWLIEPKLFTQAVHFDLGRLWQESLAQRTARFRQCHGQPESRCTRVAGTYCDYPILVFTGTCSYPQPAGQI